MKLSTLKLPTYRRTRGPGKGKHSAPVRSDLKAQNLFPEELQGKILDEVHEVFDGTYGVIRPGPWKRAFRPSGLPYCPVIDAMTGPENMEYSKAFYLDIGTTAHELMQEFMARGIRGKRTVFANWLCKDCKHMHYFMPIPYVCMGCGGDSERLHYEELEFENFRGIQGGHVDAFIRTTYGWIVADWKTASTSGLDYRQEADGKHHHQLQAYCLALQELFKDKLGGLPIIGYMLIFVPRDKSGNGKPGEQMSSNWTPYLYLWNQNLATSTRRRLFMQRASFEAASIGYETGNWYPAALMRPCESLADFGKPMGMRDGFYGGKLCPNLDVCCRGAKAVAEAISKFRTDLELENAKRTKEEAARRADYLQCADQGVVSPALLAEIAKVQADEDDYNHERLDELLGLKESLERHIALRKAVARPPESPPNAPSAKPVKRAAKAKTATKSAVKAKPQKKLG